MFDEITRILNHLMWLGAHGLDIGAMAMFLYCFREREDLMDCYEAVSGTRMHATYYRPGGVYRDLPDEHAEVSGVEVPRCRRSSTGSTSARSGSLLDFIEDFTKRFPANVDEYETLLTDNRIWKQRTVNIGVVSPERAMQLGFTGPMLRGSRHRVGPAQEAALRGLRQDGLRHSGRRQRRLLRPLPRARRGDAPVEPHHQAVRRLAARESRPGDDRGPQGRAAVARIEMKDDMESLIHHFKLFTEGYCVPEGEAYAAVEAPKGEFGVLPRVRRLEQAVSPRRCARRASRISRR